MFSWSATLADEHEPLGRSIEVGARLTGDQMRALLIGNTEIGEFFWMSQWYDYKEHARADGTIVGQEADGTRYSGSWTLEGDKWCAEYDSAGHDCFYYVKEGPDRFTAYSAGSDSSLGRVKAKNINVERGKTF